MFYSQSTERPEPVRRFRADPSRPMALLRQCPVYVPTPLISLDPAAAELEIARLSLKDESQRMRLGSFKALGGAYAVAQMILDASGETDLQTEKARAAAAGMTFITASAGNHGLSVAAGARIFGAAAVIVLGADVPEAFADRIRAAGAEVRRAGDTYEESVAMAGDLARRNGWLLLADGSWEGYLERPALVMEGYTVIAEECRRRFEADGDWPTHVFLQAGVGGLAAAMAAHIRESWAEQPVITVAEPDRAACLLESVRAGTLTRAPGPLSNMGRLDCKDASLLAFESLRGDADVFVTVTDEQASAMAERLGDLGYPTTPSGAAGVAAIGLAAPGRDARCLAILSEGPEAV